MASSFAVSAAAEKGRGKDPPSPPAPTRETTSEAPAIATSPTSASRDPRSTRGAPDGVATSFSTAAFAGSEGGSAALAFEVSFVGSEPKWMPAAGFPLPMESGALRNDKGISDKEY